MLKKQKQMKLYSRDGQPLACFNSNSNMVIGFSK